ncbi:hypothetical protein [Halomarina pelagica]|uniref:hypothetical protein n=1 Tax=Halomarina pelagica TaxID=2961599 RepID=UPI0020C4432D|nr:hypothetical protein [Halomarina sp. BND7]
MGIVEEELAEFEISTGQEYRIELNKGETIHVHAGNLRLDMSVDEFDHFVDVIARAQRELHERKGW